MDIFHIERGRYLGNIDIPRSLQTMEPGEVWHINPRLVNIRSVRNCCSLATRAGDKVFSASCPGYSCPTITIRRLR